MFGMLYIFCYELYWKCSSAFGKLPNQPGPVVFDHPHPCNPDPPPTLGGLFEPSYFCLIILFYYYDLLIRFYNLIIYSLIKIVLNNGNPTSLTLALHRQQPSSAIVYYRPPQVSIAFDIKIGIIRIHVAASTQQNRFFKKRRILNIAV